MDVNVAKKEILHAEKSSDVWRWIQAHPDEDLTEVAAYFNKLAREEGRKRTLFRLYAMRFGNDEIDVTKINATKEEILQAKTAREVFSWMKAHPNEDHTEVAAYFTQLAQQEYEREYPGMEIDFLWDPPNLY